MAQTPPQNPQKKRGRRKKKPTLAQKILNVVGIVLCVVFGSMLVCNLTIIIKGALFPDEPPSVLGVTPMVTLSGSMGGNQEGHIEVGDLIFVGKVEAEEISVGDVISYMADDVIITHRVTEIGTGDGGGLQFTTKGDANNTPDQNPVTADMLVGRYMARIPKLGDFALFLQKPIGMFLFMGIPLMLFIIYDILRRRSEEKRTRRKRAAMMAEIKRLRAQDAAAQMPQAETPEQTPENPGN